MDLDLDIIPSFRGNKRAEPAVLVHERALTSEDVALTHLPVGSTPTAIQRLSQRHHTLARMLAAGMSGNDAAAICGYSASRISILKSDPSFNELVRHYSEQKDAMMLEMHERIAGLSVDALEELRERLEDDPKSFSNSMLLNLLTATADRSGHGPHTSSTNVNVNLNLADKLEAARKRVASYRQPDVEIVEVESGAD